MSDHTCCRNNLGRINRVLLYIGKIGNVELVVVPTRGPKLSGMSG